MGDGQDTGDAAPEQPAEVSVPLAEQPSNVVPFAKGEYRAYVEEECGKELNAVLKKWGCLLHPTLGFTADGRVCLTELKPRMA